VQNPQGFNLQFTIDFTKTNLSHPNHHKIIFSTASLVDGQYSHSFGVDWNLNSNTYNLPFSLQGYNGSIILIYAIYTNEGKRITKFNRIYIDKGSNGFVHPYFQQLFDCNYSHPASFILNGNECGFCGSIDNLFSDFIELYEQGIIKKNPVPIPAEFRLTLNPVANGNIVITGYQEADGENYYFNEGDSAQLQIVPDSGFEFDTWTGTDAGDLINIDATHCSILMSKNRVLEPSFKTQNTPQLEYSLMFNQASNGSVNITGYTRISGNRYYFNEGQTAFLETIPDSGFVFYMWSGPDAVNIVNIDINHYSLLMNRNMELAVSFNPVQPSFNILSITPSDHANLNISGFDHQVGNDYYYLPNAAANIIINPLAGYDFSHFEGTGAAVYTQLGHWYFRITMNNNYTLQPIYTQL
jgi:hypothetical protein